MATSRAAIAETFHGDRTSILAKVPRWHAEELEYLTTASEIPEEDRLAREYVAELKKLDTAE